MFLLIIGVGWVLQPQPHAPDARFTARLNDYLRLHLPLQLIQRRSLKSQPGVSPQGQIIYAVGRVSFL